MIRARLRVMLIAAVPRASAIGGAVALPLLAAGCSGARIAIAEQFGYAKRQQLVDRVQDARDSQEAAKAQFESALDEFLAVTGVAGGDPEARYRSLTEALDRSQSRAESVRARIRDTDRVATALFKEWDAELEQYSSDALRAASRDQLDRTRARYDGLVAAMQTAEASMDPVLAAFKDQTLFLKHNLNAQAISSLRGVSAEIEADVAALVAEMNAAISEATSFIESMRADEES